MSSQIDLILYRMRDRKGVDDSKVIPKVCRDTDHRPVVLKLVRLKRRQTAKPPCSDKHEEFGG